jgi:uncharacterized repeat protein (TIGR03803 family)
VTVLHAFAGSAPANRFNFVRSPSFGDDLSNPYMPPIETAPGVFYGIARSGGFHNYGGIWKMDTNTMTFSVAGNFDPNAIGSRPTSALVAGDGGNLYGMLEQSRGDVQGYLYRVDTTTDTLHEMGEVNVGAPLYRPQGNLVYVPGLNSIFGCNTRKTQDFNVDGGALWRYNISTGAWTALWTSTDLNKDIMGAHPSGVVRANDGLVYFVTKKYGAAGTGTLLAYNSSLRATVKVADFPSDPTINHRSLMVDGSRIFGTYVGGAPALIWSYNYFEGSFIETELLAPSGGPFEATYLEPYIFADGGKVICRGRVGGPSGFSKVFSFDRGTGAVEDIHVPSAPKGRSIVGELTQINDNEFLGWTHRGGEESGNQPNFPRETGELVKVNVATGDITVVPGVENSFATANNALAFKTSRPILASDGQLYLGYNLQVPFFDSGLYVTSADMAAGTTVRLDILSQVADAPESGCLELPGDRMMASFADSITVYNMADGAPVAGVKTHDSSVHGLTAGTPLLASDGRVYGITQASAALLGAVCAIWSMDPATLDATIEYAFPADIASVGYALSQVGDKLYGATSYGGAHDGGYIYSYDITTDAFAVEYDFTTATDGAGFDAGWAAHEGKLYSTSFTGGDHGYGTLVEFDPAAGALTVLAHLTMANGRSMRGTPAVWTTPTASPAPDMQAPRATVSNYPNPFNPMTTVAFEVPRTGQVKLTVHDVRGRLVRSLLDEQLPAGSYQETWNGTDDNGQRLSSGSYLCKLETGGQTAVRRLMLVK